jgi:hypothetical protein
LGHLPHGLCASTGDRENTMQLMDGLAALRGQGRMTWIDEEHGWVAAPEDIMNALSSEGFEECKREMTTSRRDSRPAGGVWQGIDPRTGCVASMIWVNRPTSPDAIVFMAINGESLTGAGAPSTDRDPYREDGGEA